MKDILHNLADIMSRAARAHNELTMLQHDAKRLMRRIEMEEAAKMITVHGEDAEEAVTKLYKLIKYRELTWEK